MSQDWKLELCFMCNGKPLECFGQGNDTIRFTFLKSSWLLFDEYIDNKEKPSWKQEEQSTEAVQVRNNVT